MLNDEWRKSSRSQPQGECVEAKRGSGEALVRDSKDPEGGNLKVPGEAWVAFLARL